MNPGTRIGGCVIGPRLGAGGMGAVYRGQDAAGVARAVKVMTGAGPDDVARFEREAAALAALGDHPNLVRVHAAGRQGDALYIVMSLCEGGDLSRRLRAGPLEAREATTITAALARGLAQAHARGVLHRDLKPHNVLFDDAGRPRLTDFGLARVAGAGALTKTGDVLGTPEYMAPEQADGKAADARTDVYGLGAILFAALAGHAPHEASSPIAVLKKALLDEPRWPAADPALLAVLRRAMARDRVNRYPTAAAFADALEGWLRGEAPEGAPRGSRAGAIVAAAVVGCGIIAALTLLAPWAPTREPPPTPQVTEPPPTTGPTTARTSNDTPPARPRVGRVCEATGAYGMTYGWFIGPTTALRVTEYGRVEGARPPEVTTWDLTTLTRARSYAIPGDCTWARVMSAAISPDRRTLALGGPVDQRALLLDLASAPERPKWTWTPPIEGGGVEALCFSRDGRLVVGAIAGRVMIVDLAKNANAVERTVLDPNARVDVLGFDDRLLYVGGAAPNTSDLFLAIVDPVTLLERARMTDNVGDVTALLCRPGGGAVIGTIRSTLHTVDPDGTSSPSFAGDGVGSTMLPAAHSYEIRGLAWTRDGRLASVSGPRGFRSAPVAGELRLWSGADWTQVGATHAEGTDCQYSCIDSSPGHGYLLLSSNDGRMDVLAPPP